MTPPPPTCLHDTGSKMKYQRRLPSLFLTLVLCFSPWSTSGKTFYSHYGIKCTDDCHPQSDSVNQTYQCTVHKTDGTKELQYCSPRSGVDYKGNMCFDCCEQHGSDYYWCKTASGLEYCGDVMEDLNHYTLTYGMPCYDSCEMHSENYYWCHSTKGWNYCSPRKNVDYKGNACRQDHPCDTHGKDYHWCNLDKGGWDKCGRVEPKAVIHDTIYRKHCTDDCQYSNYYFWCHIHNSWSYCSPTPDVTYKGVPCRSDHNCGDHGYSYNWCYTTDNNDWDYCGVISPGECRYSVQPRTKRQPKEPNQTNLPEVICTQEDIDNNRRRVTTFRAVENHPDIAESHNYLAEALGLINEWDGRGLGQQARSNLVNSSNLHIDLQGLFNRNNQQYYNLQVQVNSPRGSGESTTLAHIEVPEGTPLGYMRLALRESLQNRVRVSLEVTDQPINNNCHRRH
ncbi:uncharacterized protein LOC109203547 isoform X1 [Oreochromis niloticus]|uniref:Cytokine-dependent hematopoietic cell linker n=2 Tax=Oreochromis TaxID=8139 RepID=I3J288_ORENI|nr:uncharacterized protein LOC109203547 isoform X1 [Oreochromis niloticus]XP_025766436.1 uncharacterized protein LOC109203547 isoform X1 [Oreochromis niloticus]CAI5652716.1 unnamed protein product [Mustela putorius furo]